jgi:hypothetical protein
MRKPISSAAELDAAAATVIGHANGTLDIFAARLAPTYNTRERAEALRRFLRANARNRLRIALHDAGDVERELPRVVELLRTFSHALLIFETGDEAKALADEFIVADDCHYLHRFHKDHAKGELALHEAAAREMKRRFDEIWQVSTPAVAATTLGL